MTEFKIQNPIQNLWHVYRLSGPDNELLYVGIVDGRGLLMIADAMSNPHIARKLSRLPVLTVTVLSTHEHRAPAQAAAMTAILEHRPPLNQYGQAVQRRRREVVCVETGDRYASVSAAADAASVTVGCMSNHLYRRPGFAHVKGNHYEFSV